MPHLTVLYNGFGASFVQFISSSHDVGLYCIISPAFRQ